MPSWLTRSLPFRVLQAYGESQAGNYAAGLAFNALLTMFPLMLGILSITGLLIQDPGTRDRFLNVMLGAFPSSAHGEIAKTVDQVRQHVGLLGILSLVGIVWSGTGLFAAMEFALTQIFGSKQRDFPRQRAMGVLMLIVFLLAVLVTTGINSVAGLAPGGPLLTVPIGAALIVALLSVLYRLVPNRTFSLREVLPGALLAGVLLEIFSSVVFPIYVRIAGGFSTYGSTFALFFLLAIWFVFLSQLMLLGAVFIRMRLGEPYRLGLLGVPSHEAREVPRPVDAIKAKQSPEESG